MFDWVEQRTIFKCISGSHAYGLDSPTSDSDLRGVAIPPKEFYYGLHNFEQQITEIPDITIYSLKKYVQLLRDCNPNIVDLCFIDRSEHILFENEYWKQLKNNRHLFLSKRAKFTYSGYAISQIKRIKRHKVWIGEPQAKPIPEKYLKRIEQNMFDIDVSKLDSNSYYFDKNAYENAKKKYEQYEYWKENRNKQRAELEEKYNFDTKHAMHCCRLMIMGIEILKYGEVKVYRDKDRNFLLDIRNGKYSYEEVLQMADDYDNQLNELYEKSELPHSPDDKAIDKLLVEITDSFLSEFV